MPFMPEDSEAPKDAYRELLEQALEKARFKNDSGEEAKILLDLGYWHEDALDYENAIENFEAGLKHLKATKQYAVSLPAMFHLAQLYRIKKKDAAAFTLYTDIIEFAEKTWDKQALGIGLALKGQILLDERAYENGLEFMFRGLETLEEAKLKESVQVKNEILSYRRQIPRPVFDLALTRSKIPQRIKDLLR